jgi:hypothetical protein
MTEDSELRRRKIALRLTWLQESGVALPDDLAETARTWAEEQQEHQSATNSTPSLKERVQATANPIEVADLLTADRAALANPWFAFSPGELVVEWLEKHMEQASQLFSALIERGASGQALASRVIAWLSDRAAHSEVLRCLSVIAGDVTAPINEHLLNSATRALRVLAEVPLEREEFWFIWSFLVGAATESSGPAQPHEKDPLTDSLNSPGGHLAEALIVKAHGEEAEGASAPRLRGRLDALTAGDRDFHFLARTMLASRLPWLHDIDRDWAKGALIARMTWSGQKPTNEARALWQGYLWAPQLNSKLLADLKPAFLQALICDLGLRGDENLFRLFGDLLLKAPDRLSADEKRRVFRDMSVDGLVACAHYWRQVLQGTPEGAANVWKEKIGPLIQSYWPVTKKKVTPETVEALARLAVRTNDAFPEALERILRRRLLTPRARSGFIISEIAGRQSNAQDFHYYDHPHNHPHETLRLIDQSVNFEILTYERMRLKDILQRAREADASVEQTDVYGRLYQRAHS